MAEYFADKEPRELKDRLYLALWVVVLAFFVLMVRLFHLQVLQHSYFTELSLTNRMRLTKVPAPRGLILDRNGHRLAENRPGFDLSVIPEDVQDREKTKGLLAGLVDIDEETVEEKLGKARGRAPFRAIRLKEDISWEEMARVSAYKFELPGVQIEVGPKRTYPFDVVTAHLLGYMGEISESEYAAYRAKGTAPYDPGDMIGKSGVERAFEPPLKGGDGGRQMEVDALGRPLKVVNFIPPEPGSDIRLTIDLPTQMAAFAAMGEKTGAVVALDPRDGRILALVSAPAYDPNALSGGMTPHEWRSVVEDPDRALNNRALQGLYPPASTFKVITAAAALEEGAITPRTRIMSGPSFRFAGRSYRDWKVSGHGLIDVRDAIVESSDTFFYQVGLNVGLGAVARYAKEFGLGRPTGIALGNEKSGLVPTSEWKERVYGEPWYDGETLTVAVGQSYMLATPLQLVTAYSAIANGGTLYVPQLVDRIETPGGETFEEFEPLERGEVDVAPETLALLKEALRGVVAEEKGTARALNFGKRRELRIAGKTGTAQVVRMKERIEDIEDVPYKLRDHAWFVGFAPYDDPRIAVAVVVEHGGFGSVAAAPVALRVMEAYLEGEETREEEPHADPTPSAEKTEAPGP